MVFLEFRCPSQNPIILNNSLARFFLFLASVVSVTLVYVLLSIPHLYNLPFSCPKAVFVMQMDSCIKLTPVHALLLHVLKDILSFLIVSFTDKFSHVNISYHILSITSVS